MDRRLFIRNTALTLGALSLGEQKLLASFFPAAGNIKMLRNNVGIYTERGGTIGFLLTNEGIVVIDSQFPEQSANFINEIKKTSGKPFRYLINTHHHGDHSGGNISFKGLVQNVVAHENSLKNQKATAEKAKTVEKQLYPDLTYSKKWKARVGKEKISMQYQGPAHTDGDSIIYFERANIAHMGDLMFNRRHPFIDRSAGASIQNWVEVLSVAASRYEKDTMYIFGHAAEGSEITGSKDDLSKFREYLQRLLEFAQKEVAAGTTKEVFIKNTAIPGVTQWKGDGIERPLTAAFEEVVAAQSKRSNT
jgi:glyoxylase-like metal-dependent hydrolase (beta-lactamase superfamily II)